jgi:hypothetical protein
MTVYVDNMRARYRGMIMCHMIADTDDELHAMAASVGIDRRHFQDDHYDISLAKRAKALKRGAVEITKRQAAAMRANRRCRGSLGKPETAIATFNEHIANVRALARDIVEGTR